MFRYLSILLAGASAFTTAAFGQAVTATKKSSNPIVENSYSQVDVRHTTKQNYNDKNEAVNRTPKLETRLQLGTVVGKLDIMGSANFTKVPQNGKKGQAETVKMIQPWTWTEYTLLDGSLGKVRPYIFFAPKFGTAAENGNIGAYYSTAIPDLNVGIGALKLYGEYYGSLSYNHGDNKRPVEIKDKNLSLTSQEKKTTEERHPTYELNSVMVAELKLAAVKGLSTGADADWLADYEPKYVIAEEENGSELEGYSTVARTATSAFVKYKVTDKLSLANNLYFYHNGFYQSQYDAGRYMNRVRLVYSFF
ncbi:MAG: hypothetical protein AB7T49_10820 [Oligoflexales bacterium]